MTETTPPPGDVPGDVAPRVTGRALARNSIWVLVADCPGALLKLLVLTPIILGGLGIEGYGIWGLLFGICAYIEQFDLSFGFAYAKFTAEYDIKRDYRTLANIVSSGIVVVGSGGLAMVAVIALFRDPIFSFLKIPPSYADDATTALYLVILSVMIRMSFGCYYRMLAGLQRMDLEAKLHMAADVLFFVLSLALLFTLGGITSLAIAWLVQELFRTILAWRVWCAMRPALDLSPFNATRYGFQRILSLGGKFQLLSLIGLWIVEGFRFLLSALFGPAMAGVYDLAFKIVNFGRRAPSAVIGPLMPAFAGLHERKHDGEAQRLYLQISRILAIVTFVIFGFVCLVPDLLIFGWTNGVYDPAPFMLVVLSLSSVVHLLTGVGTAAMRGRESLAYEFQYAAVQFFAICALGYPAFVAWGVKGIVAAYSLGFFLGSVWFLLRYARHEEIPFTTYSSRVILQPLFRILPACAVVYALQWVVPWLFTIEGGRWLVLGKVAILGALFVSLSGVGVWYGGLLTEEERGFMARIVDRLRGRGAAAPTDMPTA